MQDCDPNEQDFNISCFQQSFSGMDWLLYMLEYNGFNIFKI